MSNDTTSTDTGAPAPSLSLPKKLIILAAGISLVMSVALFFSGDTDRGMFVGLWVPSILSLGNLTLKD